MLTSLTLQNFRSYSKGSFDFSDDLTLIVGLNAVGKTNILEAIYELACGRSFRASEEREVIKEGEQVSKVAGKLDSTELEIIWDQRERSRKLYRVNGVGRRLVDFSGLLQVVLFEPQDIEIVADSPSTRRKYLDAVLSQVHKDYRIAVLIYERAIRQRNRLLWQVREGQTDGSNGQLTYWNELLIEKGGIIHQRRKKFLEFLGMTYDHSIISKERLAKYAAEEVAAGTTLVGPHRDDFRIIINGRNIKSFGSRGEQRLAVFGIKLTELDYVEKVTGEKPLLLLDDIFSELDQDNRQRVLKVIPKQQTILTTTDFRLVDERLLKRAKILRLPGGT